MAPFGMASVTGSDDHFELIIRRIGADPVIITGTGRDYCDLGDGIVNTLVGDLEIRSGSKLIARHPELQGSNTGRRFNQ